MKKEIIAAITGTFVGGLMLHYYINDDKKSVALPISIVKPTPAPSVKDIPTTPQKEYVAPAPISQTSQVAKPESKPLPKPKPAIFIDNCKNILSATGLKSPYISARKVNGTWEYLVPITFQREYQCETSTCYDGNFTVNGTRIDTTLKYGGEFGNNKIKVQYAYLGRKAEGDGECNKDKIIYNYIFTAGPPKGSKGVAKIAPQ